MSGTIDPDTTLDSLRYDGSKIIAIAASMLAVATISVTLRLISKALSQSTFGLDDILICLALLFYIAVEALNLRAVTVGRSALDVQDPGYIEFAKLTSIRSLLYWSVVAFATLSILFLYRRIFFMHQFFSIASKVLIGLTLFWWVSGTVCEGLGYRPMAAYWDTAIQGRYYINYNSFWASNMIAELILETATLLLPLREIVRVQFDNRKKALVMVMFCLGIFVLITGAVRINCVLAQPDMTPGVIWLSVHSATAIACACLPTYGPLLSRVPGLKQILHYCRHAHKPRDCNLANNITIGGTAIRSCPDPNCGSLHLHHNSPKPNRHSFDDIFLDKAYFEQKVAGENVEHDNLRVYRQVHVQVRRREGSESTTEISLESDNEKVYDGGQEQQTPEENTEQAASQNGLTKTISVPSPTSTNAESWDSITAFLNGREKESQAQQTRRAGLEYGPTIPSQRSENEQTNRL